MSMVTRRLIKIPSKYAEELGNDFIISKEKKVIASLGQYFTPQIIAELIAKNFSEVKPANELKILDSGAGSGILSCTLCEQITNWQHKPKHIELTAYEIDNALVPLLKKRVSLVLSPRVAMRLVFTSNVREAAGIHGLARGGMSPREAGKRSL